MKEFFQLVEQYMEASRALVAHLDYINYHGSSKRDLNKLDRLRTVESDLSDQVRFAMKVEREEEAGSKAG